MIFGILVVFGALGWWFYMFSGRWIFVSFFPCSDSLCSSFGSRICLIDELELYIGTCNVVFLCVDINPHLWITERHRNFVGYSKGMRNPSVAKELQYFQ